MQIAWLNAALNHADGRLLSRFCADKNTHPVSNSATLTSRIDVKRYHLHVHLAPHSKIAAHLVLCVNNSADDAVSKRTGHSATDPG